ncbi:hypothetical protein [Thalassotalea euphylliae]|nr:hypothetical protein [Thalassotalea euphylliae]
MTRVVVVLAVLLAAISAAWFFTYQAGSAEVTEITMPDDTPIIGHKTVSGGGTVAENTVNPKTKLAKTKHPKKPETGEQGKSLTSDDALGILTELLDNIASGTAVDIASETSLIAYLKETSGKRALTYLVERLKALDLGAAYGNRVIEYGLSLLAAVKSTGSTELMLEIIREQNWQGSDAIYLAKKSITKVNRQGNYTALMQQTFEEIDGKSPFLDELASSIAKNAQQEQVKFLFNYVDEQASAKGNSATNALKAIQTESLVPVISQYLVGNSKPKTNAALNTLANMGQYEAVSILISWSAGQPKANTAQIAGLFDIATRRSPSAVRAIEKEVNYHSFVSADIKNLLLSYLD